MARPTAYYATRVRPAGFYRRFDDETVVQQIRAVTNSPATYVYRRVWAMVNRIFRTGYNRKRIRRLMRMHDLMLPPRVHRRHGRPHLGQVQQPASNQRWCSDVFLIPCWSGEVLSVAFAIDCYDREVPAYIASPRALTGADILTLMDRLLWARFGETTLMAPHAIQWLSSTTGRSTRRRPRCCTRTSSAWSRSQRRPTARRATVWPRPSWARSNAITSARPIFAMPRRSSRSSADGSRTTTPRRRTRRSAC